VARSEVVDLGAAAAYLMRLPRRESHRTGSAARREGSSDESDVSSDGGKRRGLKDTAKLRALARELRRAPRRGVRRSKKLVDAGTK